MTKSLKARIVHFIMSVNFLLIKHGRTFIATPLKVNQRFTNNIEQNFNRSGVLRSVSTGRVNEIVVVDSEGSDPFYYVENAPSVIHAYYYFTSLSRWKFIYQLEFKNYLTFLLQFVRIFTSKIVENLRSFAVFIRSVMKCFVELPDRARGTMWTSTHAVFLVPFVGSYLFFHFILFTSFAIT